MIRTDRAYLSGGNVASVREWRCVNGAATFRSVTKLGGDRTFKLAGYRTFKLSSGTTSEPGRYVKFLGEPRGGR